LYIHLYCLVLDGVYRCGADGVPVFVQAGAPLPCGCIRTSASGWSSCAAPSPARALADERVQLNDAGQVGPKLKTPWRDGTTHLVMSPLEFLQRLAALVPLPPVIGKILSYLGLDPQPPVALRVASASHGQYRGQP
jgi:hypothetical protein